MGNFSLFLFDKNIEHINLVNSNIMGALEKKYYFTGNLTLWIEFLLQVTWEVPGAMGHSGR